MKLNLNTDSPEQTESIGERIGKQLKGSEVIELISDMGGGKTTFVRGLARGAGSSDQVSSPTFKICNVYKGDGIDIHHYDFYRLAEGGIMSEEIQESIEDPKTVVVVEWGEVVEGYFPQSRLVISIAAEDEFLRKLEFRITKDLEYLVESIC